MNKIIICSYCNKKVIEIRWCEEIEVNSQVKKDVGTLSNPLSGDTKQGGIKSQDDTKLQIERSASLPVDNQLDNIHSKKEELEKDYVRNPDERSEVGE